MSETLGQLFTDLDQITAPYSFYPCLEPVRAALAARNLNDAYHAAGAALSSTEIRGPILRGDLADWRAEAKAYSDGKRETRAAA